MTPQYLELLAQVLARLEPKVFAINEYTRDKDRQWDLHNPNTRKLFFSSDGNLLYGDALYDDRLFGAVWRCAVARDMRPTVVSSTNKSEILGFCSDANQKPHGGLNARAATPGIALALAFCAARGKKVKL